MVSTLIWIVIGVGVFWLIYLLTKNYNKVVENVVNITPEVVSAIRKVMEIFDKDPTTQSPVERVLYYAEIATKAVEQSYKKVKEEKKKMLEDGVITKEEMEQLYKSMKEEAMKIVKQLAEVDGFVITSELENIVSYAIEAMVFFLPKSNT